MTTRAIHAFDTLVYEKKLKAAGFTEKQAEAQASALADVVNHNLVTKHDLKQFEIKLDHKLKIMEHRIIMRLASINVVTVGFFSGLIIHFS